MPAAKERAFVRNLPWETTHEDELFYEDCIDLGEGDIGFIGPNQVVFHPSAPADIKQYLRLHSVYAHRDESEWIFRLLHSDSHVLIDLQRFPHHGTWKYGDQERVMERLDETVKMGDNRAFSSTLDSAMRLDWLAEDFAHAVRLALEAGTYTAARQLLAEATARYPDDPEIRNYARALAPPQMISSSAPPDLGLEADQEWLEAHRGKYRGQWVAVRDGKLLGVAQSLRELIERVGDTKGALLTTGY